MSNWNNNIFFYRKKFGFTQKQVIEKIQEITNKAVRPSTYSDWEAGKHKPQEKNLEALAKIFNVSTSELTNVSDKPTPELTTHLSPKKKFEIKLANIEAQLKKIEDSSHLDKGEAYNTLKLLFIKVITDYKKMGAEYHELKTTYKAMKDVISLHKSPK